MDIKKISNTEYEVTFTTRPRGATNMLNDEGKRLPGIKSTHTFDISKVNPDGVEIPEGIIALALSNAVITFQTISRLATNVGDINGLKNYLDKHEVVEVGAKAEKGAKKSSADLVGEIQSRFPGITGDEIVKLILTKAQEPEKYKVLEIEMYGKYKVE